MPHLSFDYALVAGMVAKLKIEHVVEQSNLGCDVYS